MGLRSHSAWFGALASALVCSLVSFWFIPAAFAADGPAPGAWVRPVAGAVAQPFVQPRSHYGAGHRGVDFVAAPGTPVRAANAGVVAFAGNVAGTLHVVVSHAGGLRTSSSFLATITVRRGTMRSIDSASSTSSATCSNRRGAWRHLAPGLWYWQRPASSPGEESPRIGCSQTLCGPAIMT